ncbi:hypothetical protein Q672_08310 [Marinobacter sp. EVN1]|nr:hypothetical protein Q672_08310 [Marinobacter sp. EVN1]
MAAGHWLGAVFWKQPACPAVFIWAICWQSIWGTGIQRAPVEAGVQTIVHKEFRRT